MLVNEESDLKVYFPWGPSATLPSPFPIQSPSAYSGFSPGRLGWLGFREARAASHTWDAARGSQPLWGWVESCKGRPCGCAQCRWGSSGRSSQCSGPYSGAPCLETGGVRHLPRNTQLAPDLCKHLALLHHKAGELSSMLPISQTAMDRKRSEKLKNVTDTRRNTRGRSATAKSFGLLC